jgi:hypothetical protein
VGTQDPKDVTRETARDLSALVWELAALKGDAALWLTDAEYAALRHRLEAAHAAYVEAKRRRNIWQFVLFGVQSCFDPSGLTVPPSRYPLCL